MISQRTTTQVPAQTLSTLLPTRRATRKCELFLPNKLFLMSFWNKSIRNSICRYTSYLIDHLYRTVKLSKIYGLLTHASNYPLGIQKLHRRSSTLKEFQMLSGMTWKFLLFHCFMTAIDTLNSKPYINEAQWPRMQSAAKSICYFS